MPPPVIPAVTGPEPDDVGSRTLVRPAILLLLRDHDGHGYELSRRLAQLDLKVPPTTGALYRSLRAMADEGLVTSYWSTPQRGPARRVYAITDDGEEYLERSIRAWTSLVRSVGVMLDRYWSGR